MKFFLSKCLQVQHPQDGHYHSSRIDINRQTPLIQGNLSEEVQSVKTILYYAPSENWEYMFDMGQQYFNHCSVSQCYWTNDSSLMPSITDFDAIVLRPKSVAEFNNFSGLPNGAPYKRSHRTIYIMITRESPRSPHISEVYRNLDGKK